MSMVLAGALVGVLGGCAEPDPWAGAPLPPVLPEQHAHYAIKIGDQISGREERWIGPDGMSTAVVRHRTWSVRLGGEVTTLRAASRADHAGGPVQAYERWSEAGSETWAGITWIPDAVPPPASGLWPVFDPWTMEVRSVEVTVEEGRVRWSGAGGPAEAEFDAGGLVWASQGAVRLERSSDPIPFLKPFDPVALLAIPVPPQPRARRSLIGRFEVDGQLVQIDAPIWAQVPSVALPLVLEGPLLDEARAVVGDARDQRQAVQRLVLHVAQRLDGRPTPGSLAAVDALKQGRGDCDEAAAAFVALARALGLDANPVGGLVYATGALGPALYPHAWATVRVAGREVPVDPALGQAPADASHLALGASAAEAAARLSSGVQVSVLELR